MKRILPALAVFLLVYPAAGQSLSLSGGETVSGTVTEKQGSDRWTGIVSDSATEVALTGSRAGAIQFNDSSTGNVIEFDSFPGPRFGGFYAVFVPKDQDFEFSNLTPVDSQDLQKNGLFSEQLFPAFYPNYTEYSDAPDETFTSNTTLRISDRTFETRSATLEDDVPFAVLNHSNGSRSVPVFVSPLFSKDRFGSFTCSDGENCATEALLPRLNQTGNQNTYGLHLTGQGDNAFRCGGFAGPGTRLFSGQATRNSSCINITGDSVHVSMFGGSISGSGTCGARIEGSSDSSITSVEINGFRAGVCADRSSSKVLNGTVSGRQGVRSSNSDLEIRELLLNRTATALNTANGTRLNASEIKLGSAQLGGSFRNVEVSSAEKESTPLQVRNLTRMNISVNVTPTGSSELTSVRFDYPPLNESRLVPRTIVKLERNSSAPGGFESRSLPSSADLDDRQILFEESITSFSIFSVYGVEAPADNVTRIIDREGAQEEEGSDSDTDSGQDESPEQTEDASAPATTRTTTRSVPIEVNLSAPENLSVERGGTKRANISVENMGEVASGALAVSLDAETGWTVSNSEVESLSPGESSSTSVLVSALETAELGLRRLPFTARQQSGPVLDYEFTDFDVKPSQGPDVDISDAPTFITLSQGESTEFGSTLRNAGPETAPNVTLRAEDTCIELESGTSDIAPGGSVTLSSTLTLREEGGCSFSITAESPNNTYDFKALSVTPPRRLAAGGFPLVLPAVYILWSAATIWRVVSRRNE